jgi:signal transduction histidine kinase
MGILIVFAGFFFLTTGLKASENSKADSTLQLYFSSADFLAPDTNLKTILFYIDSTDQSGLLNTTHFVMLNEFSEKIQDTVKATEISRLLDHLGVKSRNNGNYAVAINYHELALKLAQRFNNKQIEAIILNNIGVVHRRLDNYEKALDFHMQALKIAEKNNDLVTKTIAINSIGNVQVIIGNLDEAEKLFTKSYEIEDEIDNQLGIAINLNNLGNVFKEKGDLNKAINYYNQSLKVNKQIGNDKGIAICYSDLGNIYQAQGDQLKGLKYNQMALQINLKLKDKNYLAYSYIKLGESYVELGNNDMAKKYLMLGLELSKEINSKYNIADAYNALFKLAYNQGNYKEAVNYLQMDHQYNDSILNLNIRKEIARLQINFDSERQEAQINALQQQAKISQLNIERQKTITLLAIGAFTIALILVTFLLFFIKSKNKTNRLLTHKNKLIEQAGKDLDSYAKQLLAAKKEAEKNSRVKSEFLAHMSHEIRTPLNSVIGFSELLYQTTKDPKHLSYLKTISRSGKSLLTLINDILDLSKIEAQKFEIQYTSVDIRAIILEITQLFTQNAIQKDLQLVSSISNKFPERIMFSDIRFRQILFNLVGNAIKFTSKGKIEIIIDCNEITEQSIDMILYVKDTGSGISEEDKNKIFTPFNQTEEESKHNNGTGLGLSITKRLVKMMDGEIQIESYQKKGSIFSVYFTNIEVISKSSKSTYDFHDYNLEINVLFLTPLNSLSNKYFDAISESNIIKKHLYNHDEGYKQLSSCDLIVFHENENADNASLLKLLSSQHIKSSAQVIFIGDYPRDFSLPHKTTVLSVQASVDEFIQCIAQLLKIQELGSSINPFFNQTILYIENLDFINSNKFIFHEYFLRALNTKLINHIQVFSDELMKLGIKFHDESIVTYCHELDARTADFDTVGIDLLLKLYEHRFITYTI